MQKNSCLFILFLCLSFLSKSQFGNEWIDPNQTYYSFKIVEDDFYRLTREELLSVGFPVATVPVSRIALFRKGIEMAINVSANPDGTIDYLEFYATGNDGTGDQPLYEDNDQPHSYYSLFSDSATYFLTYRLTNTSGERMPFSADRNATGLTPEPYHLADSIILRTSSYGTGIKFGSGSAFSLAEYDDGEGWTGSFRSKNQSTSYQFELKNWISTETPLFETVLVGGNSLAHNVRVSAGNLEVATMTLSNVNFSGWRSVFSQESIPTAQISGAGMVDIELFTEGFPGASDRVASSYGRIVYAQGLTMLEKNKEFNLKEPEQETAWLQISTPNPLEVDVFRIDDFYQQVRVATTPVGTDRLDVVLPSASENTKIIAVVERASVGAIQQVAMPNYSFDGKDYLIITHPALTTDQNAVGEYEAYRTSIAGGGHQVLTVEVQDLYNAFNFGDPSPIAIKRFITAVSSVTEVGNVFFIGKGYTPFVRSNNADRAPFRFFPDRINVPTFGYPGSDQMFSVGLSGDPELPTIPTGRLNATNQADVLAYLDKIKEMEALPYDDLFRKDFLQLSGGISQAEIRSFENVIEGFSQILETDFIGGRSLNTGKQTSNSVEFINVEEQINNGVGFVTFFGHSSGTVTDIEIGRVSDPQLDYNNKGKYPVFLVNGCKAGEIFGENITFGEDWMITPEKGAIGFTAHADNALSSSLRRWSNLYYGLGYGDSQLLGTTVGDLIVRVGEAFFEQNGRSDQNLAQVRQMVFQGDPAYVLFGAEAPDYSISASDVSITSLTGTQEIIATQDSFLVDLVVKNFGRTVLDSLEISVNRTFADGTMVEYPYAFPRVLRQDTLSFYIPNLATDPIEGINTLRISLDQANKISELDEANNVATIEVSIFSGNTLNLFPIDNGIEPNPSVNFRWQSSNPTEAERSFDLEVDTDPSFASPNRRTFNTSSKVFAQLTFDFSSLALADSSVVYWRTRLANPAADETNEWVTSSFTIIADGSTGWGQYEPSQLEANQQSGVFFDPEENRWKFIENRNTVDIFTFGTANSQFADQDVTVSISGIDFTVTTNTVDPFCQTNTLNAVVFDKETGDPYRPIITNTIDVFNREVCGRLPQRIYQFREQDLTGTSRRLQVLIDNMNVGDQIILFSWDSVAFSQWDAPVFQSLEEIGIASSSISALVDGQPVIAFGSKNSTVGSAIVLAENGSSTAIKEQSLQLIDEVVGRFSNGSITSRRIGPSNEWETLSYRVGEDPDDNVAVDVIGFAADGTQSEIFAGARLASLDVSTIDPVLFPELELVFEVSDEIEQTPAQLEYWQVAYQEPPDAILLPASIDTTKFTEGAEIIRTFWLLNTSNQDFNDSISVNSVLINQNSGDRSTRSFKVVAPVAGDTTIFETIFPSFDQDGANSIVVEFAPEGNEVYRQNNRVTLSNVVEVVSDETNPILDVTFDGSYILNGDIVSPNPSISILLRDDNPFATKSDTSGFDLSIKGPREADTFERINFTDPNLTYRPASDENDFEIIYQAGPFENGVHTLRVTAEDKFGNAAGSEPYEIEFEVVNESSITHFYPYPNPFSTSCRFVFTLTGSEIPDEVKIQILTVSGRVVREITQDEIGPLRIGNNITEYAWDGRDEFGDQLANGVYFYKVFTNIQGEELNRRATSADRGFKRDFGKLYILR